MKVNTGVLKSAETDLRACRNCVERINDELSAVIAAVSDMKGIECIGKLRRISYDIEYSSYVLSEMSGVVGDVAEIYERTEEKIIEKREISCVALYRPVKPEFSVLRPLTYADCVQVNPSYESIAKMIGRFI